MAVTRPKAPKRKALTRKNSTPTKKAATAKAAPKKAAAGKPVAAPAGRSSKAAPRRSSPARAAAVSPTPKAKSPPRQPARLRAAGELANGIKPYKAKAGEAYMNKPQRAHFREILLVWKRELMEEVDRTVHHMQDEAGNFPDPNDRASQESEFSLELRTRDRERKLLRKIDEALKYLEVNEYGWCESCGAEIGIRRLEARPTATLCIDCKTLDEIRERQNG